MSTGSRSFQNQPSNYSQENSQRFPGYSDVHEEEQHNQQQPSPDSSGGYGYPGPAHHQRPPPLGMPASVPYGASAAGSDNYRNYYHNNASMTAAAVAAAAYSYHYHQQQQQQEQAHQQQLQEMADGYESRGQLSSNMYSDTNSYGRNLSHPHLSRYLF